MDAKNEKIGHYSSLLLLKQAVIDAKYNKFR
jgi:hypothetical protein